ncbi:MAG: hypothetical protein KGY81_00300, partial [Phycisphaerae bacterium]|nr:hypothetical protein [Phycisphaerae bacterium]
MSFLARHGADEEHRRALGQRLGGDDAAGLGDQQRSDLGQLVHTVGETHRHNAPGIPPGQGAKLCEQRFVPPGQGDHAGFRDGLGQAARHLEDRAAGELSPAAEQNDRPLGRQTQLSPQIGVLRQRPIPLGHDRNAADNPPVGLEAPL